MGRPKKIVPEWDIKLKKLYEAGLSLYEIYKMYGIHPWVVRERLIAQGIAIRDFDQAIENRKKRKNNKKKHEKK